MKAIFLSVLFLVACGPQGPAGPQGPRGGSCSVSTVLAGSPGAPNGGSLLSCQDGSQSMLLNGTNGTNGTVVAPVQFCINPVTTYPSTFAEVGFCIGGALYAVYSANGGFETHVLNGNYGSNGINASCSFTVTGCVISNQSN